MKDLTYLEQKPIAVLGAGGIGKAIAADCVLGGQDVILCDLEPFASKTLANLENGFRFHGAQTNKYGFYREGVAYFNKTTTSVKEAVEAVSYTHLDVYKRQEYNIWYWYLDHPAES